MNPGLEVALDMHRGCGWSIQRAAQQDQPRQSDQRSHHADDKPSNKGSDEGRRKQGLDACVQPCSHVSE